MIRLFRENEASLFGADVSRNVTRVLKVIKNDVNSNSQEIIYVALQILGACLYDTQIARWVSLYIKEMYYAYHWIKYFFLFLTISLHITKLLPSTKLVE